MLSNVIQNESTQVDLSVCTMSKLYSLICLSVFVQCILCHAQSTTLWTLTSQLPSQLLQTINNTFYPNIEIKLKDNLTTILQECEIGCHVLYSSYGNYPTTLNPMTLDDYHFIAHKSVNIYIELPQCILATGGYCIKYSSSNLLKAKYERAVVISSKLSPLKDYTIIDLHEATWLDISGAVNEGIVYKDDLLMMAKVAGYDYALYQFDQTTVYALLYQAYPAGNGNMIVSTTSFSDYSLARYVPSENVKVTLTLIINKLMSSNLSISEIKWIEQSVQPSMNKITTSNNIQQSFQRGIDWITDSKLLVYDWIQVSGSSGTRQTPSPLSPIGDGTKGIFEGFASGINSTGGQDQSIIIRTDCQGEIAGSLAWSGYINNDKYHSTLAYNLINFIYNSSIAQQGNDSQAYGILLWGVNAPGWNTSMYCDDNARAILGSMQAIALLHDNKFGLDSDQFVPNIVRAILGNFRLTSKKGFCLRSSSIASINSNGWESYWNGEFEFDDPHYESWMWCTYLFTYHVTGYQEIYQRTVIGIGNMMNAFYAGTLHWANGLTQEYSRLLLPLAFLNRVENGKNSTHIKWLMDVGTELKSHQVNGTIEEYYGNLAYGSAKPPQNNPQYGTTEAPMEQVNGDPVSDTLYTLPFALWGLHEAYLVTNQQLFYNLLNNLTQYLIKIQVMVDDDRLEYKYLNGSWLRGFDFNFNEYFASASDIGWGPTSVESGWTVGEILSSFGMIMTNNSFFDIVNGNTLYNFDEYVKQYIPIFGLPPM